MEKSFDTLIEIQFSSLFSKRNDNLLLGASTKQDQLNGETYLDNLIVLSRTGSFTEGSEDFERIIPLMEFLSPKILQKYVQSIYPQCRVRIIESGKMN
jgi:hypothetical protein